MPRALCEYELEDIKVTLPVMRPSLHTLEAIVLRYNAIPSNPIVQHPLPHRNRPPRQYPIAAIHILPPSQSASSMQRSPSPQPWSAQDAAHHTPSHRKFNDICFCVGYENDARPFLVDPRIAIASPYLRDFVVRRSRPAEPGPIYLPKLDPKAFEAYLYWLCAGYVPFPHHNVGSSERSRDQEEESTEPREKSLSWLECFPLLAAHVFGSNIQDAAFMDYIMTQLERWLLPVQQPHVEILEWAIAQSRADKKLKEFILDRMFGTDEGVKQLLHILSQRVGESRGAHAAESSGCKYHVHGVGSVCRTEPRHLQSTLQEGERISIHNEDPDASVEVYENFLREIETGDANVVAKNPSSFRIEFSPNSTRAGRSRFSGWRESVRGRTCVDVLRNLRRDRSKTQRTFVAYPSSTRPLSLDRPPSSVTRPSQPNVHKPLPPTPTALSSDSSSTSSSGAAESDTSHERHLHSEIQYPRRLSLTDGSAVMPQSPMWQQPAWSTRASRSTTPSSRESLPTIGSVISGRPISSTPPRRISHVPLISRLSASQTNTSPRSSVFWTRPPAGVSRISQLSMPEDPPTGPMWPPPLSPRSMRRKPVVQYPVELEADSLETAKEKIPAVAEEGGLESTANDWPLREEAGATTKDDEGLILVEEDEHKDAQKVRWEDTY